MTPTQRTLAALRKRGITAEVVERWIPRVMVRKDLFSCIDIVALDNGILGIQTTSAANVSSRMHKAEAEPRLAKWLASGGRFEVWGWKQNKKSKRWSVRRVRAIPLPRAGYLSCAFQEVKEPQRKLFK